MLKNYKSLQCCVGHDPDHPSGLLHQVCSHQQSFHVGSQCQLLYGLPVPVWARSDVLANPSTCQSPDLHQGFYMKYLILSGCRRRGKIKFIFALFLHSSFGGGTFAPLQNAKLVKCCSYRYNYPMLLANCCWALLDGYRPFLCSSRAQSPQYRVYAGKFATLPAMNSCCNLWHC